VLGGRKTRLKEDRRRIESEREEQSKRTNSNLMRKLDIHKQSANWLQYAIQKKDHPDSRPASA